MKKFTSLFVVFFLLSFASISLAAEIKLQDTSSSSEKSIAVSINTKGELTENVKIVIENSSDVTITDIVESDISCSTFSYVPGTSNSEIICTLPSKQAVQGLIAKILFTATSEDYEFTIVKESSKVGDLTIENVTNVGEKLSTTTNDTTTMEESSPTPSTTTETSTTATSRTTAKETKDIMTYIPYILLGVAGIFLISIIVLLLTKKKDHVVLTDVPASVMPPQPTQPTPQPVEQSTQPTPEQVEQPTQQPVNFENIPQNLQNETMHDNIVQPKPTLAEMINQPAQTSEQTVEQTPITPETPPVSPTPNEQADLEELLRSENPSMTTDTTQEMPDVTSSQQQQPLTPPQPTQTTLPQEQTTPLQQPEQTTVADGPSTINGLLDNYSANVSEGGLPEIGSTSPLESPTTEIESNNQVTPNLGSIEQPIETVQQQDIPTTGMDTDLQNSVNMEINNIPEGTDLNTLVDNTQQNPTVPTPTE